MAREQMGTDKASDADVRQMIVVYYGMTEYADAQLRRLVDEMRQRGLMDNTWVVISADHGDYSGEKGLFTKTESLYECLLHVPLIIVPPEGTPWDRSSKVLGLVDHIDLFPTILGIAGVDVPEYAQGHDLLAWLQEGGEGTDARRGLLAGGRVPRLARCDNAFGHLIGRPAPESLARRAEHGVLVRPRP